jgi:uncharacterized protein (DUF2249 family)
MKTPIHISIHPGTRIKVLLDQDKQVVIDQLVKLNSNFSKLKNPVLRNLFASRVTIADACKIAHCKVEDFLQLMSEIGFSISSEPSESPLLIDQKVIDFSRQANVFKLDARSYLENNQDPLKDILAIVNKMVPGERFELINSFEPTPLISLLTEKGFSYDVEAMNEDLVMTRFERNDTTTIAADLPVVSITEHDQSLFNKVLSGFKPEQITYIDVRDLEMPKPMLLIIENVDQLPSGGLLYIYHKKVPVFLLPELNKRGMAFLLNHQSASAVDMLIYRS